MEQIIAASITAIVTLIVALIAVGPTMKSFQKDLRSHADDLGRDHQELKQAQKECQGLVRQDIAQVANTASFLRDAQIREDARREQLKGQKLNLQKTIDTLVAQQRYIDELKRANEKLQKENLRLIQLLNPDFGIARESEHTEEQEP